METSDLHCRLCGDPIEPGESIALVVLEPTEKPFGRRNEPRTDVIRHWQMASLVLWGEATSRGIRLSRDASSYYGFNALTRLYRGVDSSGWVEPERLIQKRNDDLWQQPASLWIAKADRVKAFMSQANHLPEALDLVAERAWYATLNSNLADLLQATGRAHSLVSRTGIFDPVDASIRLQAVLAAEGRHWSQAPEPRLIGEMPPSDIRIIRDRLRRLIEHPERRGEPLRYRCALSGLGLGERDKVLVAPITNVLGVVQDLRAVNAPRVEEDYRFDGMLLRGEIVKGELTLEDGEALSECYSIISANVLEVLADRFESLQRMQMPEVDAVCARIEALYRAKAALRAQGLHPARLSRDIEALMDDFLSGAASDRLEVPALTGSSFAGIINGDSTRMILPLSVRHPYQQAFTPFRRGEVTAEEKAALIRTVRDLGQQSTRAVALQLLFGAARAAIEPSVAATGNWRLMDHRRWLQAADRSLSAAYRAGIRLQEANEEACCVR